VWTASLPATSSLSVGSVNGKVSIDAWGGPGISVRAEIHAATEAIAEQVDIHASAGEVSVEGPSGHSGANWLVDLRIEVPPATALTISTVDGGVAVHGAEGDVVASAVKGNLWISVGGDR
jgi:hypothetical protein